MIVFIGPTLRRDEISAACDAVCLPPAAQGDVYRATLERPRTLGIVDGYFSGAPSVWHKEILWALSQGIHVFGSASMGALRAAELHSFGMRGVGRIFEAFRDGVLEDDDEVAVVHGPAETGFIPVSEPMVNIRASLIRAERDGILTGTARHRIEEFAKSLFFPQRSWATILGNAVARGVTAAEVARLGEWLPAGRVDQKREDALEMLAEMKAAAAEPGRHAAGFTFEWTSHWDAFVARTTQQSKAAEPSLASLHRGIIDELRLEGEESYRRVRERARLRLLADREANRLGLQASPEAKRASLGKMRAELGLFTRAQLEAWLQRNHLDPAALEQLIEEDVRAQAAIGPANSLPDPQLLDELRLAGAYERLAERAQQKRELLAALPPGTPEGALSPPDAASLRLWFFEERLSRFLPDDMSAYMENLGFSEAGQFDDAIRDEWIYIRLTNE